MTDRMLRNTHLVTIRPKYACPACKGGVTQAKTVPHLIEGALPTEGAIDRDASPIAA
jgi:transposase